MGDSIGFYVSLDIGAKHGKLGFFLIPTANTGAETMASRWIVKRKDKEQGPFSSQQLKKLADSGQLRTTDWVRKHDSDQFVKAEKVKGLFDSPPVKSSKPSRGRSSSPEMLVAEVVEVVDDAAPKTAKSTREDFDDGYIDYDVADDGFEDFDADGFEDYEDYEAPAPRRSASRRTGRDVAPRRAAATGRKRSSIKPKTKKARKRKSSSNDDEDGPWQNLYSGVVCIAVGVGIFFAIGPEGVEISGVGLITWTMMLLNYIGGRWAILGFFVLAGVICLHDSFKKFTDR